MPVTLQAAFADQGWHLRWRTSDGLLSLTPPVMLHDIKRAYRRQALKYHPDCGGGHAAMIKINAAYELALEAS